MSKHNVKDWVQRGGDGNAFFDALLGLLEQGETAMPEPVVDVVTWSDVEVPGAGGSLRRRIYLVARDGQVYYVTRMGYWYRLTNPPEYLANEPGDRRVAAIPQGTVPGGRWEHAPDPQANPGGSVVLGEVPPSSAGQFSDLVLSPVGLIAIAAGLLLAWRK